MKVLEDELVNFLGNDLSGLESKLSTKTLEKLIRYDRYTTENFYLPVIGYFLLAHQIGNRSMRSLQEEIGLGEDTLIRIFDYLGLLRLTPGEQSKIWGNEKVIKKLQEEASELGYSPHESDVGRALYHAASSVFGSWNKAKEAAGLVIYQHHDPVENRNGNVTVPSRIRGYLNNNPSTYGEIRKGLKLRIDVNFSRMTNVRYVGPYRHKIYYLAGQEHLLPLEYQDNRASLPTK